MRQIAGGWTREATVQDPINNAVADAMLAAEARMPSGLGKSFDTVVVITSSGMLRAIPIMAICAMGQSGAIAHSFYFQLARQQGRHERSSSEH